MCADPGARRRRRGTERGLTISELLIAMGLTGLVAVMLLAAAQVQTSLQRQQGQTQYVQDNVRSAMEEIAQSVRRAGTSFISMVAVNGVPPFNPQRLMAVDVLNNYLGAGPDALNLILVDDSETATLMQSSDQNTVYLLANRHLGLQMGSLFTLANFYQAFLYRLVENPTATALAGVPVWQLRVSPPGSPVIQMSRGSAVLHRVSLVSYRIDTTVIPGTPVLVLQDGAPLDTTQPLQLVAENIEDLQIAVGVDGLFAGVADGRLDQIGKAANDDEWVYNYPGEVMPAALPKGVVPTALRVTVVGRTATTTDNQLGQGRPPVEDRPAGPNDGFRRRILTTQVALRAMATN